MNVVNDRTTKSNDGVFFPVALYAFGFHKIMIYACDVNFFGCALLLCTGCFCGIELVRRRSLEHLLT